MNRFDRVEDALRALKNGEIIMVSDDEDRENEGDLICAAQFATTENVNFMAVHARGLICMPMSGNLCDQLGLGQMVTDNTDNHETAFTVSVDHKDTTTGISAVERGYTARKCVQDDVQITDFRRPGHMFPLRAKEGGVLVRNGHTEATVDLMRLAGLKECGLCCEIMRDDGTMMRMEELQNKAKEWKIRFITIAQIQEYRRKNEKLIRRVCVANMPTKYGMFKAYGYINLLNGEHHVALVKKGGTNEQKTAEQNIAVKRAAEQNTVEEQKTVAGQNKAKQKTAKQNIVEKKWEKVLCRVHSECLTGDAFGSIRCDCGEQYAAAMKKIEQEGEGVLLYMRQEGRGIGLINKLRAYELQDQGLDTLDANLALGFPADMRKYDIAAQILRDLNITSVRLMTNNPEKVKELEKYDVAVTERIPLQIEPTKYDLFYLKTKQHRMGHILNYAGNEK